MRDESGSALVEVAIGVSICFAMIIGAAEFGRLCYAGIEVSDVARAGVQYGAQSRTNAADIANVTAAATQDVLDVKGIAATACLISASARRDEFDLCRDGLFRFSHHRVCPGEHKRYRRSRDLIVPGLPKSYKLTGKAVMRVEQ